MDALSVTVNVAKCLIPLGQRFGEANGVLPCRYAFASSNRCLSAPFFDTELQIGAIIEIIEYMRYWWANQNQNTYRTELSGGYLWSPRHRADGSRNPFYDNLRLAQPGDMVFAFHESAIRAVGIVVEAAIEAANPEVLPPPKTDEKAADPEAPGWLLNIAWLELLNPFFPAQHMSILEPLLPSAHSPLTPTGRGLQGGRLLELRTTLALPLLQLVSGRNPDKLIRPSWRPSQLKFQFEEEKSQP